MEALHISLLGRFDVRCGEETLDCLSAHKAQEMLCYLLLHRDRPHRREALTSLMWPTCTATQSMKSFRHTLWQLRAALDTDNLAMDGKLLLVDLEWIGINPEAGFWLDVAEFERVYSSVQGVPGRELQDLAAETVREVLDLYRGDLLEGCYQDWCILERERLRQMYLTLIEKQMVYCEVHAKYQAGLEYGIRALRCEAAQERIHRRLMRLHYLAGDRIASLRQYERCVAVLRQELGVAPSPRTIMLYKEIRSSHLLDPDETRPEGRSAAPGKTWSTSAQTSHCLTSLQLMLVQMQRQLQEAIDTIELAISRQR
jgi:two-component SAPR family response regulator